jgi:diketogulonate reductase-like aldo/keto reductase
MITRRTFLAVTACALATARTFGAAATPATTQAAKMITRKIPRDGTELPVIGLGTWNALNPEPVNETTLAPRVEVLKIFFESGARLIDTAPSYGTAEHVVGLLTTQLGINKDVFIATKVLEHNEADGISSMQQSLKRLNRDKIELMQVHSLNDTQRQMKTLRAWKEKGTFRYIGITHSVTRFQDELTQALKQEKPDFVQVNYSLGEPDAAKNVLPAARDLGIAVLINRPFVAGQIFKKLEKKPLTDSMKPYAKTWAQVCLKWVIAHPDVTCALPATGKPEHMRDNAAAGFGELPDEKTRQQWLKEFAA